MKFVLLYLSLLVNPHGKDWSSARAGTYKIISVTKNTKVQAGMAQIKFEFKFNSTCIKSDVKLSIDGADMSKAATEKEPRLTSVVKQGKHVFRFYSEHCGSIVTDTLLLTEKTVTDVEVEFKEDANQVICFKPVIYLYPEKETKVNVQFDYNGNLEFTYPKYPVTGWDVNAFPDGTLETNNKKYNYLFWDGKMDPKLFDIDKTEGSVVKSTELVSFFESSLTAMGLNTKEIQDFITFWTPKMMKNDQNYIHFLFTTEYDQVSTINVNPKPDNMLRIYMLWSDATVVENIVLREQTFPEFKRIGFTLVEWGGSEVPNLIKRL